MPSVIALLLFSQCFYYGRGLSTKIVSSLSIDRAVWLILLAIGLYKGMHLVFRDRRTTPLLFWLPFFGLVCTLSWYFSGVDPNPEGKYRFLALIGNFIYIPATVYFICSREENPEKSLQFIFRFLSWLGLYLCFTAFAEHYRIDSLVWPTYILDPSVGIQFGRARGPFAGSAELGSALILTFLATALRSNPESIWQRMTTAMILAAHALAIYFTYTRSVWLAFGLVITILFLLVPRLRYQVGFVITLIFLMAFTGASGKFTLTGRNLFTERQGTVDYRLINYSTTLRMALDNPLFGVGYGRFYNEWPRYYRVPSGTREIQELTDGNHNTFLGIFAELGLIGIIPHLMILFRISTFSYRAYWRSGSSRLARDAAFFVVATVAAYCVDAQFLDYRSSRFFMTCLFAFFGYLVALKRLEASADAIDSSVTTETNVLAETCP